MPIPNLEVGQKVMAKWPKSSLYFPGSIIDFNDIEYLVRFEDPDQSELAIKHRNVSSLAGFRRPSRSRSRSRSWGRTAKKGGKSPGRPKKPRAKQEAEKELEPEPVPVPEPVSEPEPKKEPTPIPEAKPEFEPVVIQEVKEVEVQADPIEPVIEVKTSVQTETETETVVIQRTSRLRSSVPLRQSARIASMLDKNTDDEEDDVAVNNIREVSAKSTAEEAQPEHKTLGTRMKSFFKSVGCTICNALPALATLKVLPLIVIVLGLPLVVSHMCTKKKCTVQEVPSFPMKLDAYYSLTGLAMFSGFLLTQLLLYFVPLGRKISLPNGASVRCNGFISLILTLVVVPLLMNFNVDILAVYTHLRHLLASYTTFALVLSLLLFYLARNASEDSKNPGGNSGLFFPDLFVGRQIAPCIRNLDVKHFLIRISHLSLILFSVIIIIKDLQANSGVYSPTLMVASTLQIFLGVDMIWMEDNLFTTFEYNRRGCGLMTVANYCGMPFVNGILIKLVLHHRTEHEWYILSLIAALNLVGYIIFRGANSQKHTYRLNPSDPALCHLESLPTAAGTRLLVSGWWGIVRHPNYLGNIIILLSQLLLCGFDFALPWLLYAAFIVFSLLHINEVESHCQTKYGTAWESYCSRIKYKLVPRVF